MSKNSDFKQMETDTMEKNANRIVFVKSLRLLYMESTENKKSGSLDKRKKPSTQVGSNSGSCYIFLRSLWSGILEPQWTIST